MARLLYVGSFGYYPNRDAINYFCTDILPLLRERCSRTVEVITIGAGLEAIGAHPHYPGVHFVGPVPDTTPYYANCDAAIVPLRAGGGTRIKILEAFSHQRPVISTSLGAEGLDVVPGVHLAQADSPETFAQRCLKLIEDEDERQTLARNGHAFFIEQHAPASLEALVADFFT